MCPDIFDIFLLAKSEDKFDFLDPIFFTQTKTKTIPYLDI
jgi:hypothetical protein